MNRSSSRLQQHQAETVHFVLFLELVWILKIRPASRGLRSEGRLGGCPGTSTLTIAGGRLIARNVLQLACKYGYPHQLTAGGVEFVGVIGLLEVFLPSPWFWHVCLRSLFAFAFNRLTVLPQSLCRSKS